MAKRMKLREAVVDDGINRPYCGPYAIQVATGCTYRKARAEVNKVRGKPRKTHVSAMYGDEINTVLINMGYTIHEHRKSLKPTLREWIDRRDKFDRYSFCIVRLTRHYVVVKENGFIDNHTKKIVRLDDAPHLRSRVKSVIYVS